MMACPQSAAKSAPGMPFLGALVLVGLAIYSEVFWDGMTTASRIVGPLASGLGLYIMGLILMRGGHAEKLAGLLFLLAALLQPRGLFVLIDEQHVVDDPTRAELLVYGIMCFEQCLTFWVARWTAPLFFTIVFSILFLSAAFHSLDLNDAIIGLVIGFALIGTAYVIGKTTYSVLTTFCYVVGSTIFLFNAFSLNGLPHTPRADPLIIAACCFVLYLSIRERNIWLALISVPLLLFYLDYLVGLIQLPMLCCL